MDDDECVKASQENCVYIDFHGDCLVCDELYQIDSETKSCVEVEADVLEEHPNCAYFDNDNCLFCAENYYVSGGECTALETKVDNCEEYQGDGICLLCKSGFWLEAEDTCTPVGAWENCIGYSLYRCDVCAAGYVLNRNLF